MDSVIQISLGGALTLIGGFFGAVLVFGKLLVSQFERRMTEKFAHLEQGLASERNRISELAQKLELMAKELPLEYVRREDWIRFSATIDAKLDRLAEWLSGTRRGSRQ